MSTMKAEQAIEQDKLHLVSATDAAIAERDQEHPLAGMGPLTKQRRETAEAIEEFKTSTEPMDVAAAAFVERLGELSAPRDPDDDFKWDMSENSDVVCVEQRALAIYTNRYGQAVIRQERHWPEEEDDTWICISKSHLQDVIDRLQLILSSDG